MKYEDKEGASLIKETEEAYQQFAWGYEGCSLNIQAEKLLQEKEARYSAIVEAFDGFIYICSRDYRVEFMNERFIERTGYDGTGGLCYKTIHDRDSICPWCVNDRVFNGETVRWEVQSPKDNHWFYVMNTPIYRPDGSISKQSMILDITDRKRMEDELRQRHDHLEWLVEERTAELLVKNRQLKAEIEERRSAVESLQESETWYRMLFETTAAATVIIEEDTTISLVNDEFEKLSGYSAEEMEGEKSWAEFVAEDDLERMQEYHHLRRIDPNAAPRNYEFRFIAKGGSIRDAFLTIAMIPGTKRSVASILDITDRKQVEDSLRNAHDELEARVEERTKELMTVNKELESFSYTVSHDLRAPLRAIDGYSRMILKKQGDKFDEDTMRKFNVIRSSAQIMGQLIDDLLAFSRLGKKELSMTKLDVDAIIRDVWNDLKIINPDRKITLTVRKMPYGRGDGTLIKQVYFNLLSNAVKFTKYRDAAHIEAGSYADRNEDVYYVKDNGAGFDMAYYDRLFGVFQRLHSTDDFEGTGVGLATVQRIIQRHGGRVWAEGKPDQGACFYFTLQSVNQNE